MEYDRAMCESNDPNNNNNNKSTINQNLKYSVGNYQN